jgi:hypothetical protein
MIVGFSYVRKIFANGGAGKGGLSLGEGQKVFIKLRLISCK